MNKLDQNQVIADIWETPLTGGQSVWLSRQLYTGLNNYFFFHKNIDGPTDPVYVLTIRDRETFKISDESDCDNRLDHLLKSIEEPHIKYPRTYKIWNSPLALEACRKIGMSHEEYDQMEKYQYLVVAGDEIVEFVTMDEPKWEIHKNIHLDDLVIQYLKKDPLY